MDRVIEYDMSFGLWGGVSCGKTTYLAALNIAAIQNPKGNWSINGVDIPSSQFLSTSTASLLKGRFMGATTGAYELTFKVSGENRNKDRVCLTLKVIDPPGGSFNKKLDDDFRKYLADSRGLIFFINASDPINAIKVEYIQMIIDELKREAGNGNPIPRKLDKKLAVCLSQYDAPAFFKLLREENLIEVKKFRSRDTPFVKDVRKAIKQIHNGEFIMGMLESNFNRVNYFAFSSIGFFNQPDGSLNIEDCSNIAITPGVEVIKSGIDLMPVNVWRPLSWFAE